MRVLIADRNGWLLESIARTFAPQFRIQTATTHAQCVELLRHHEFDLVVVSEKLADGRGLQLLSQIARSSPDTLRVFSARRSRLKLLKGKLGPFGLFRTLAYPIIPQELLSALTLARAGLEVEMPPAEVVGAPRAASATTEARPSVEEVRRAKADRSAAKPTVATNPTGHSSKARASAGTGRSRAKGQASVKAAGLSPMELAATMPVRTPAAPARATTSSTVAAAAPTPTAATTPAAAPAPTAATTSAAVAPASARPTPVVAHPPGTAARSGSARLSLTSATALFATNVPKIIGARAGAQRRSHQGASRAAPIAAPDFRRDERLSQQANTRQPSAAPEVARGLHPTAQAAPTRPQPLASAAVPRVLPGLPVASPRRMAPASRALPGSPMRNKVALAATIVLAFLATAVTLNRLDASAHVSHASSPAYAEAAEVPPAVASPQPDTPASVTPPFQPAPSTAPQRIRQPPDVPDTNPTPADTQVAASAPPPRADPSTFGSEAYEPIYVN